MIEADVNLLVDSDPEFETIKATNSSQEVVRLIERVFNEEGTILSVEEAAKTVENALLEQTIKQMQRLNQVKKIQSKLAPALVAEKLTTPAKPGKTLTNAMGVSRQLTARERAILAFNNQLK